MPAIRTHQNTYSVGAETIEQYKEREAGTKTGEIKTNGSGDWATHYPRPRHHGRHPFPVLCHHHWASGVRGRSGHCVPLGLDVAAGKRRPAVRSLQYSFPCS